MSFLQINQVGPYLHSSRPLQAHHVARILGVPVRTVRYWAKTGRLMAFKDPKRPKIWLFQRDGVRQSADA